MIANLTVILSNIQIYCIAGFLLLFIIYLILRKTWQRYKPKDGENQILVAFGVIAAIFMTLAIIQGICLTVYPKSLTETPAITQTFSLREDTRPCPLDDGNGQPFCVGNPSTISCDLTGDELCIADGSNYKSDVLFFARNMTGPDKGTIRCDYYWKVLVPCEPETSCEPTWTHEWRPLQFGDLDTNGFIDLRDYAIYQTRWNGQ